MKITRNDGTVVEQLDYTKNISVDINYPYEEFIRLPEVPMQRNTLDRLQKARKHLKNLRPEHCVVNLVKLTKDVKVSGKNGAKIYDKGMLFRIDGNTRALNWKEGGSDVIPQKLIAITYEYETIEQIKDSYNTFDSVEATEKNNQKVFGILTGIFNYSPVSEKLKVGQVLSGVNKACHLMFPNRWNQTNVKTDQLEGMLGKWMVTGELQALDKLMTRKEDWCQPFICAALMSLSHYGPTDQKLLNAWKMIASEEMYTPSGKEWDGVSHIVYEWCKGKFFRDVSICRDTRWDNMEKTVSYILYWLDKYMADEKGYKVGKGWDEIAIIKHEKTDTQPAYAEFPYSNRPKYNSELDDLFNIEG